MLDPDSIVTAASTLLFSLISCVSGYGTVLVLLSGAARTKRTHESTFFTAGGRNSATRSIWYSVTLRPMPKVRISVAVTANDGDFTSVRMPTFKSCIASSSQFQPQASRERSSRRCGSPNFEGSCIISRCSRISRERSRS
jgi:hypothetical protein